MLVASRCSLSRSASAFWRWPRRCCCRARRYSPPRGLRYTVITLLVVVLGGMTNFVGIMLGGLIIGIAEAFGTIYLDGAARAAVCRT